MSGPVQIDGSDRNPNLRRDHPNSLDRVTAIVSGDGERPSPDEITEALGDHGDGEYLFVPLDGDAFTGGIKITQTVDVQWTGSYV